MLSRNKNSEFHAKRICQGLAGFGVMGSDPIIGSEGSEAFLRVKPLAAMPRIALRRAGKFMIAL
jgi:hypothetical protein